MEALNDIVRSGKVRYIGASGMHMWQVMYIKMVQLLLPGTKTIPLL